MSRPALALLIFLAGFTALAQPGLCPCWLVREVRIYHPHPDSHPERPHPHGYLLELFNAEMGATVPPFPTPARTVIVSLAHGSLWRRIGGHAVSVVDWAAPPPMPPPRLSASS